MGRCEDVGHWEGMLGVIRVCGALWGCEGRCEGVGRCEGMWGGVGNVGV